MQTLKFILIIVFIFCGFCFSDITVAIKVDFLKDSTPSHSLQPVPSGVQSIISAGSTVNQNQNISGPNSLSPDSLSNRLPQTDLGNENASKNTSYSHYFVWFTVGLILVMLIIFLFKKKGKE